MNLGEEQIEKFKALYMSHFGKALTEGEARDKANKLLRMMRLVYQPINEKELQLLKHKNPTI